MDHDRPLSARLPVVSDKFESRCRSRPGRCSRLDELEVWWRRAWAVAVSSAGSSDLKPENVDAAGR